MVVAGLRQHERREPNRSVRRAVHGRILLRMSFAILLQLYVLFFSHRVRETTQRFRVLPGIGLQITTL